MSAASRRILPPRRRRASDRLRLLARRRLTAAGSIALVDAVADALQDGRVGAASDLLGIVVFDPAADEIVSILLGLDADADQPAGGVSS